MPLLQLVEKWPMTCRADNKLDSNINVDMLIFSKSEAVQCETQLAVVNWVHSWRRFVHRPSRPNRSLLTTRTKPLVSFRSVMI